MFKKILVAALTGLLIVACSAKSNSPGTAVSKKNPPSGLKSNPSTSNTNSTPFQGSWRTNCISPQQGATGGTEEELIFAGNVATFNVYQYTTGDCSDASPVVGSETMNFSFTSIKDPVYAYQINWLDDDGNTFESENAVVNSNGLSLSGAEDPNVYVKE